MHNLLLLPGTTLVTSGQPQHWGDTMAPLEVMLTAVLDTCGVTMAVPAASLHCNTTHCNSSEIHGIFFGAAGTGLSTCQCCRFGDSPYTPWGRRLWPRQALATCAHCPITHHCGVGTRWFCSGVVHTSSGTPLEKAPPPCSPSSQGLWVQHGRCCSCCSASVGTGAGRKPRVTFL